ncbi:MAG: gluconate 2-dehydrogenase subunit 3 family protein [Deltaproteobacteria bacterium]|nr:gluconate 2-dehydrogenase subunit 3 family protein [Deltaproteobacteria bacterium]
MTSGDAPVARVTRRRFLGGMVTLVCAPPIAVLGCGEGDGDPAPTGPTLVDGWEAPAGAHLAPERFATLAALFDALIPGDETSPGATQARAAWYVDQLLGAFDVDPPRIFAGGPYSGRHGGADGFAELQPLTRVEELRWRTFLEGSLGIPGREWNGPVIGLGQRYEEGLDEIDRTAVSRRDAPFRRLPLVQRRALLEDADPELVALAYGHAVEGSYGDPVYGGNRDMLGWSAIDYEGDRQPIGYTARQMSHPEEG